MDGAGDVVNGVRLVDELAGRVVIEADGAWVGQLGQTRVIGLGSGEQFGSAMAAAIISRPSSECPMVNTFTRGLDASSRRKYL